MTNQSPVTGAAPQPGLAVPIPTVVAPWKRVRNVFASHNKDSVREQADLYLFVLSIIIEYTLLLFVFLGIARREETFIQVCLVVLMLALFAALGIHQFLIVRNFSLPYSLSGGKCRGHELLICLLFGVFTGELGYLIVLLCANAAYLPGVRTVDNGVLWSRTWWLVAEPLRNAATYEETTRWFCDGVAAGLKFVFACGAAFLSAVIFVWDVRTRKSFADLANTVGATHSLTQSDKAALQAAYPWTSRLFILMDLLAALTWLAALGTVLPRGLPFASPHACALSLGFVAFVYFLAALARVLFGRYTLNKLSSDEVALNIAI